MNQPARGHETGDYTPGNDDSGGSPSSQVPKDSASGTSRAAVYHGKPSTGLDAPTLDSVDTSRGKIPSSPDAPTMDSVDTSRVNEPPITLESMTDPNKYLAAGNMPVPRVRGFDVMEEIGRGGMGVVFKARELTLNRLVALKMVNGEKYPTPENLLRFRLEAEIAARVRHPNVVQVYESGIHDGQPFLVLEWVQGGTLSDIIKDQKTLPPPIAARMMSLLSRAVHQAHSNGVVHRDLKPGNVLLAFDDESKSVTTFRDESIFTRTGMSKTNTEGRGVNLVYQGANHRMVPKITDFGLAKLIAGSAGLTETGRVMGTPEYMSPEQAAGKTSEIGPASDIHSLGVMLYQLLAGETPFRAESTVGVIRRVIDEEPAGVRQAKQKVPRDLETICMKCLRKKPEERYPTAADLADDLDAWLTGRPIAARPAGFAERAWKLARRNPALSITTASAVLMFLGGFAAVTSFWMKAKRSEAEALRAARTAEAVNQFLITDMLGSAAPEKTLGREITVADVLKDAGLRIEANQFKDPLIEAGVRYALGKSYRSLGKWGEAETQLRKTYESQKEALGIDHADTLKTARELAITLDDAGKWDEAERIFHDAHEAARIKFGPNAPPTLEIMEYEALALANHEKAEIAVGMLRDVLKERKRTLGEEAPETLLTLNDLGMVQYGRKAFEEAEKNLSEAAAGRRKTLGNLHPDTLTSINNLAAVADARGEGAKAEELMKEVLDTSKKVRGPDHPDTLTAMNNLGRVLFTRKEYAAAQLYYQDAYESAQKALGDGNPLTLKFQHNLATCLMNTREIPKAVELLKTERDKRLALFPPDNEDTLQATHDLGAALAVTRKDAEALPLLEEAYKRRKAVAAASPEVRKWLLDFAAVATRNPAMKAKLAEVEPELVAHWEAGSKVDPITVDTLVLGEALARCLEAQGKRKEAEGIFLALYTRQKPLIAGDARKLAASALGGAQNMVRLNNMAVALPLAAEAVDAARKIVEGGSKVEDADTPRLAEARLLMGQIALALNKPAEAEVPLRDNYASSKIKPITNYDHGVAANLLGRTLRILKKYDDAEPLLLEGFDLISTAPKDKLTPEARQRRLETARQDLVALYTAWMKDDKAKEWKDKDLKK